MTTEIATPDINPIEALQCEAQTDIGLRREENQDSYGVIETPNFKVYCVADGMGGVKGGAIASNLTLETLRESFKDGESIDETAIIKAIAKANTVIFERGSSDPELLGMGTTVVLLAFTGTKLLIANVGDSRAYRFRSGALEQLTEDHTLVNELVRAGTITEDQAGTHPVSHMLTRSLGPLGEVEVDCFESYEYPQRGDVYLLCSDGLYNMVHPDEFAAAFQSLPLDEIPAELISLANLRGGMDNITVIVVKIGERYPLPIEAAAPAGESPEGFVLHENGNGAAAAPPADDDRVYSSIDLDKLRAVHAKAKEEETKDEAESKDGSDDAAKDGASESPSDAAPPEPKSPSWVMRYAIPIVGLSAALTIAFALGRMQPTAPPSVAKVEIPIVAAPPSVVVSVSSSSASAGAASSESASSESTSAVAVAPASSSVAASSSAQPLVESSSSSLTVASSSSSEIVVAASSASASESVAASSSALSASSQPAAASSSSASSSPSVAVALSRPEILNAQIANIQEKLGAFDRPISGKLAETLGLSLAKLAELEHKEESLNDNLQAASSQLSRWLGFKRKLEEQNPIDLAAEVAGSSPAVKEKQEAFQRATWAYLQAYESWQNSSSSPDGDKKVQQLAQGRTDAMATLTGTIKTEIDDQISKSDKSVGDITFERDGVTGQIRELREEIAFARILVGNNLQARDLKKNELKAALARAQSELKQLEILAPQAALEAGSSRSAGSSSAARPG